MARSARIAFSIGSSVAWEQLCGRRLRSTSPTVKQHLAAIRKLFDYLTTGGILESNPASSVRGPKYVVRRGKTPVLSAEEARKLLDSIDITTLIGLRDRALIGMMVYSFAGVGATVTMRVGDYFQHRKRLWLRLHEKGGKRREVPCHPSLEGYLDAYIKAAGIASDNKRRLFRSMHKGDKLTDKPMSRFDVFQMIKRRAKAAALPLYPPLVIHSGLPGSRPTSRTAARSSTPRPSRTTNRRPSFTTAPGRSYRSMRSKGSKSNGSL